MFASFFDRCLLSILLIASCALILWGDLFWSVGKALSCMRQSRGHRFVSVLRMKFRYFTFANVSAVRLLRSCLRFKTVESFNVLKALRKDAEGEGMPKRPSCLPGLP